MTAGDVNTTLTRKVVRFYLSDEEFVALIKATGAVPGRVITAVFGPGWVGVDYRRGDPDQRWILEVLGPLRGVDVPPAVTTCDRQD